MTDRFADVFRGIQEGIVHGLIACGVKASVMAPHVTVGATKALCEIGSEPIAAWNCAQSGVNQALKDLGCGQLLQEEESGVPLYSEVTYSEE